MLLLFVSHLKHVTHNIKQQLAHITLRSILAWYFLQKFILKYKRKLDQIIFIIVPLLLLQVNLLSSSKQHLVFPNDDNKSIKKQHNKNSLEEGQCLVWLVLALCMQNNLSLMMIHWILLPHYHLLNVLHWMTPPYSQLVVVACVLMVVTCCL